MSDKQFDTKGKPKQLNSVSAALHNAVLAAGTAQCGALSLLLLLSPP
jgi:hypothetical protein